MQQQKVHYPLGAHLIVKHFGYTHHGIYAGRGRVIHYSGFAHLFKKHPIEITSIENFSHGRKITVNQYQAPKYKGRKVAGCAHACMKTTTILLSITVNTYARGPLQALKVAHKSSK